MARLRAMENLEKVKNFQKHTTKMIFFMILFRNNRIFKWKWWWFGSKLKGIFLLSLILKLYSWWSVDWGEWGFFNCLFSILYFY